MDFQISGLHHKKMYLFIITQAHQKPLISISPLNDNLFYTSSEDNTIRLWDLRL